MSQKFDARQTIYRGTLNQLSTSTDPELDNLLSSINTQLKPTLRLKANNSLVVSVESTQVTDSESNFSKIAAPIGNQLVTLSSGSVTLPASNNNNITVSPGSSVANLNIPTNNYYAAILVLMLKNGELKVKVGNEGSTVAAALANLPRADVESFIIGAIVARNVSGNIQNINQDALYQINDVLTLNSSISQVASASSLTSAQFTSEVIQSPLIKITGTTSGDIHGLFAGIQGQQVLLYNDTSETLFLKNDSSTETTAANRLLTSNGADVRLSSKTSALLFYDSSSSRWKVASQSASGTNSGGAGRNYFSDPEATIISYFVRYADAAAPTPVDGVGGSPASTTSLNTSTPIIGSSSYRFSKASGNRQGEGWSITTDIALDAPVLEGQPITVQFRYRTSANYAAGDVKMFVYLVGPNTVQALTGIRNDGVYTNELGATGGSIGQFTGTTNATATTTAIRVIGHIATGNTANYDIDVDEITIGTAATLTAPIVTDWVNYTPTITHASGGATNYTVTGRWRRVGDNIEVIGKAVFSNTSATFSDWRISLPSGFTVDSTKDNFNHYDRSYGLCYILDQGFVVYAAVVSRVNSTTFNVNTIATVSGPNPVNTQLGVVSNTSPFTFGNTDVIGWHFSAPVTQFANSTNIISSTQAQFQAGAFRASRNGVDQTGINPNVSFVKINFNSVSASSDFTRGGFTYDTANSRFVANKPMVVNFTARMNFAGTNTLNANYVGAIYLNGSVVLLGPSIVPPGAGNSFSLFVSGPLRLNAGDVVEVYMFGAGNNSVNTLTMLSSISYFTGIEIPDLSVVGISGAPVEVLSATSAVKTPVASGHFHAHTGNSLTLQPGIWRLRAKAHFTNNGSSTGYFRTRIQFGTANGGDSTVEPTVSGLTILNGSGSLTYATLISTPTYEEEITNGPEIIISVTSTQTVFANTQAYMTTPANSRITVRLVAERIR